MKATQFVEQELRPALPPEIKTNATWTMAARDLMDSAPEVYAGIVARMADGETNASLAKVTGFSIELMRKIRDLHPQVIEAGRKAAFARIEEALHSAAQRLADNIDTIPVRQLPITLGILVDKVQLLSGGATSRVEKVNVASPADLQAMFDQLPEAQVEKVQTIEDQGPTQEDQSSKTEAG